MPGSHNLVLRQPGTAFLLGKETLAKENVLFRQGFSCQEKGC